jgi:hypothetical protein
VTERERQYLRPFQRCFDSLVSNHIYLWHIEGEEEGGWEIGGEREGVKERGRRGWKGDENEYCSQEVCVCVCVVEGGERERGHVCTLRDCISLM